MAVQNKETLLEKLKAQIGEDTSDEAIALIEDVSDTIDDMNSRLTESGDWKTRYEENDAEWRKRYKDRFYSGESNPEPEPEPEPDDKPKTFSDLFK